MVWPHSSCACRAYVLPRAGRPTITIAIRPEWNSLPDIVLYSWAGALSASSGTSWMPSMKVLLLRRYLGALAAMSAVLLVSVVGAGRHEGLRALQEGVHARLCGARLLLAMSCEADQSTCTVVLLVSKYGLQYLLK